MSMKHKESTCPQFISRLFVGLLGKAESIHYLFLTLAIIGGSVWTLYTFDVLRMKDNAVQELTKAENELSKVKLELKDLQDKIDGTDSSYIEIKTHQFGYKNGKYGLIVNVLVQNTGTNDVDMTWKNSPLTIFHVETRSGDEQKLTDKLIPQIYDGISETGEKYVLKNLYLFVGAKKELSFFVELPKPGLYYVLFKTKTNGQVTQKLAKLNKNGVWFSSKYIYIKNK